MAWDRRVQVYREELSKREAGRKESQDAADQPSHVEPTDPLKAFKVSLIIC